MFSLHEKVILTYSPRSSSGNMRSNYKTEAEVIKVTKTGRATVSWIPPHSSRSEKAVFNPNGTQYGSIQKNLKIAKAEF